MKRHDKYIERFEQLIRVMSGLTPHEKRKHFDMDQWGRDTECGTTMCAAGFCGVDPWFRRRGFKFTRSAVDAEHTVEFGERVGWPAVVAFFFDQEIGDWDEPSGSAESIFREPETVSQVIAAAKRHIKELRDASP